MALRSIEHGQAEPGTWGKGGVWATGYLPIMVELVPVDTFAFRV